MKNLSDANAKLTTTNEQLTIANDKLAAADVDVTRLRLRRDAFKSQKFDLKESWNKLDLQYKELQKEYDELRKNYDNLLKNNQTQLNSTKISFNLNYDSTNKVHKESRSQFVNLQSFLDKLLLSDHAHPTQSLLSAVYHGHLIKRDAESSNRSDHNSRYQNVDKFRGDSQKWKAWRLALMAKLRHSWMNSTIERFKIEYARDHCAGSTFIVIEHRANYDDPSEYRTVDELLSDLEATFSQEDRQRVALDNIINSRFRMGVWLVNETYDDFVVRLNNTFFSLEFGENLKKQYLEDLLSKHLSLKLNRLTDSESYNDIVAKIRKIDRRNRRRVDINFVTKTTSTEAREPRRQPKWLMSKTSERISKASTSYIKRIQSFSKTLVKILQEQFRCYKCAFKGHKLNDENAFCKDKDPLSVEQIVEKLRKEGMKVDLAMMDFNFDFDQAPSEHEDDLDSDSENE